LIFIKDTINWRGQVYEMGWLNLDEFIKKINWDDDKELLEKVLEKALKKEKHFGKITIKEYSTGGKK